ncbi:MAG: hypothetical protein ACREJ2_02635 [Planctomycetota bacterium]
MSHPPETSTNPERSAPESGGASGVGGADDLAARLRDAALGELDELELARLHAEIAARPDAAQQGAELARLARLERMLGHVQSHPALGPSEPVETWRMQTLHKAKVEAARLRRTRQSAKLPVARPPISHRQLAGLVTGSETAPDEPEGEDLPAVAALAAFAARAELRAQMPPERAEFEPGVRRFFWVISLTLAAGLVVALFVMAQLLHHWDPEATPRTGAVRPPTAPAPRTAPVPADNPEQPLTDAEQTWVLVNFLGAHPQVLFAGRREVRVALSGAVMPPFWGAPAPAAPSTPLTGTTGTTGATGVTVAPVEQLEAAEAPANWEAIALHGKVQTVRLTLRPVDRRDLTIEVDPVGLAAATAPGPGPAASSAAAARNAGGWEVTIRQPAASAPVIFEVPAPPGGQAAGLAIERVPLATGQEQLRFWALPAADADQNLTAADSTVLLSKAWVVLSEHLLPAPAGPGHWRVTAPAESAQGRHPARGGQTGADRLFVGWADLDYHLWARLPRGEMH